MEFPEDFNQLELLNTHGHLIPRGASSLWTGSKDDEEEVEEEDEGDRSEEWYLEKEETLKDKPKELILWAAENNRVSDVLFWDNSCSIHPCSSLFLTFQSLCSYLSLSIYLTFSLSDQNMKYKEQYVAFSHNRKPCFVTYERIWHSIWMTTWQEWSHVKQADWTKLNMVWWTGPVLTVGR